jgi:replication-associated recombination protein RarA
MSAVPESLTWKQAYLAAILEKDRTRVEALIQDARMKLSDRLVEIAGHSYSYDEVEAIHDAEYLLQALQSSLSYRTDLQN